MTQEPLPENQKVLIQNQVNQILKRVDLMLELRVRRDLKRQAVYGLSFQEKRCCCRRQKGRQAAVQRE